MQAHFDLTMLTHSDSDVLAGGRASQWAAAMVVQEVRGDVRMEGAIYVWQVHVQASRVKATGFKSLGSGLPAASGVFPG